MNRVSEANIDLINLPVDIFHVVRLYLSVRDYRQLLNSNKLQYSKLKKYTVFYPLTSHFSWKFIKSEKFRNKLCSMLSSAAEQLGLTLIGASYDVPNVALLHNLYRVELNNVSVFEKDLTALHDIHNLVLNVHCDVGIFPKLQNIHTLHLRNFRELIDVSNLSDIVEVKLVGCRYLTDIIPLQNCQALHFENCSALADISCLGKNQRSITLIDCPHVHEVNHLQDVRQITLKNCRSIQNVDNLANVPILSISEQSLPQFPPRMHNRKLVLDLRNSSIRCGSTYFDEIDELTIKNFDSHYALPQGIDGSLSKRLKFQTGSGFAILTNRINLQRLYELEISECDLESISRFGNVPVLIISQCPGIKSLEGLGQEKQRKVVISSCFNIANFFPLQNVPSVEIINCPSFTSLNALQNVQEIKVRLCGNLNNVSDPLPPTCHSVEINLCFNITSLRGLEMVKNIIAIDCLCLSDISTLGKRIDQTVYFNKCSGITSIQHLREIKQVKIQACNSIRDLNRLSQRENLIIAPDMEGRIEQEKEEEEIMEEHNTSNEEKTPVKSKQNGFLTRFFCRK